MPPHLHPRSRMTSSLFATTLLASFLVVGVPHILPCPAPRIAYTDGEMAPDGTVKRRKRRKSVNSEGGSGKDSSYEADNVESPVADGTEGLDGYTSSKRSTRECPIPKPGGIVGELLGFKSDRNTRGNGSNPTTSP